MYHSGRSILSINVLVVLGPIPVASVSGEPGSPLSGRLACLSDTLNTADGHWLSISDRCDEVWEIRLVMSAYLDPFDRDGTTDPPPPVSATINTRHEQCVGNEISLTVTVTSTLDPSANSITATASWVGYEDDDVSGVCQQTDGTARLRVEETVWMPADATVDVPIGGTSGNGDVIKGRITLENRHQSFPEPAS